MYTGTIQDLRNIRARWILMTETTARLSLMGYDQEAEKIRSDAAKMGMLLFFVTIPCIICENEFITPVQIGDMKRAEPNCCICVSCDNKSMKEVMI